MKKTNDLTIGAMFGAIYGVILLLVRYLFPSTDSLIYYVLPLPLAIYTYWKGARSGLILFFVSVALGFLICDPYRALMLLAPNFLIGFVFGLLKNKSQLLSIVLTFISSLIANFLSVYAFELISGVPYLEYMFSDMDFIFEMVPQISTDLINNLLIIILPIVLIVDALIKSLFLYLLFMLIAKRLKLELAPLEFKLKFSYWIDLIYVFSFIITMAYLANGLLDTKDMNILLGILILSVYFILSFYLMYLGVIGLRLTLNEKGKKGGIWIVVSIIIFPIAIILGLIYSFMYHQKEIRLR